MTNASGLPDARDDDDALSGLATNAALGDKAAFAGLYEAFSQRIFNLVLRSVHNRPTAEDICQEIWLKVHAEIPRLRDASAVRSWLYRIASRACIDFARSPRARERNDEALMNEFIQAYQPEPDEAAIRGSDVRMVWETLGTMAPRQSIALYLKQVDGRSYDEIADILGCSIPTVEALLFRARQSFVRVYDRAQTTAGERCHMFQQVIAGVIDEEPTRLQRSALEAHAQDCRRCRSDLVSTRRAVGGYAALPMLPVGKGLLLPAVIGGGAAATAGAALPGLGILGGLPSKLLLIAGLFAAGGAVSTGELALQGLPGSGAVMEESPAASSSPGDIPTGGDSQTAGTVKAKEDTAVAEAESNSDAGDGSSLVPRSSNPLPPASPRSDSADESLGAGAAIEGPPPPGQEAPPVTGAAAVGEPGNAPPAEAASPSSPVTALLEDPVGTVLEATGEIVAGAAATLDEALETAGEIVDDTLETAGDVVEQAVEPVEDLIEPLAPIVENLTGVSPEEVLDDVTELLPDEGEARVEDLLDDVTDPILGPILEPPASPEPATPPEEPCLLGLLLC